MIEGFGVRFSISGWISVSCLVAVGCAQTTVPTPVPARTGDLWWSPALGLPTLGGIEESLGRAFDSPYDVFLAEKGAPPKPAIVTNCENYFQLREEGYEPLTETDLAAFKLEGARCNAIRALRAAQPGTRNRLDAFRLESTALSLLPPAMGPENSPLDREERQRATELGKSWGEFNPGASIAPSGPYEAKVVGSDWTTELELLGLADFNGDGSDDLLVRSLSYGKEGSWREVRLRLLSRPTGKKLLTIVDEKKL